MQYRIAAGLRVRLCPACGNPCLGQSPEGEQLLSYCSREGSSIPKTCWTASSTNTWTKLRAVKEKESMTVAQRKLESSYMKFIKSAQKFYRGYIQSLNLTFGNIPELERVARKVHYEGCSFPIYFMHLWRLITNVRSTKVETKCIESEPREYTHVMSLDTHSPGRFITISRNRIKSGSEEELGSGCGILRSCNQRPSKFWPFIQPTRRDSASRRKPIPSYISTLPCSFDGRSASTS